MPIERPKQSTDLLIPTGIQRTPVEGIPDDNRTVTPGEEYGRYNRSREE